MTEEDSKNLGKEVAKAMVSSVLAASPRLDTFSTWLMGITTGFLVILFTNIERTVSVIKIVPAKGSYCFFVSINCHRAFPEMDSTATSDKNCY